jgi:hypothetical protein
VACDLGICRGLAKCWNEELGPAMHWQNKALSSPRVWRERAV